MVDNLTAVEGVVDTSHKALGELKDEIGDLVDTVRYPAYQSALFGLYLAVQNAQKDVGEVLMTISYKRKAYEDSIEASDNGFHLARILSFLAR